MSLLAELERRNVICIAGLYLVGAWLLVQMASTLFPAFGVPGWALRALVIVLALGFVPAFERSGPSCRMDYSEENRRIVDAGLDTIRGTVNTQFPGARLAK